MRTLSLFLMLLLLSGCGKNDAERFTIPDDAVPSDTGLKYVVLKEGDGKEAKPRRLVKVHYTGWLMDGKKFDSSKQPFEFRLGAHRVIAGWEEGVLGMRVGEKRRLYIPPDLGYGAQGYPPTIPKNAMLVFEVELIDVAQY
jgi:FKBP-type peptidyl-prolyl cis-trans isomerase